MQLKVKHLKRIGRTYYAYRRVPEDVSRATGKRYFSKSLGNDMDKAVALLPAALQQFDAEVRELRRKHNVPVHHISYPQIVLATQYREAAIIDPMVYSDAVDYAEDMSPAAQEEFLTLVQRVPASVHMDRYLDEMKGHLKASTLKQYKHCLGILTKGNPDLPKVTRDEAGAFLRAYAKNHASGSVTNMRSAAVGLYRHHGWDASIWQGHVIRSKRSNEERGVFTRSEVNRLFRFAKSHERLWVKIAAYSALRRAEVASYTLMEEEDGPYFVVSLDNAKTRSSVRRVPVHSAITDEAREWASSERIAPGTMSNAFADLMERAGVPETVTIDGVPQYRSMHSLRHSALAMLREEGVSEEDRASIAGHSTKTMTSYYSRRASHSKLREAIEKINWENPSDG